MAVFEWLTKHSGWTSLRSLLTQVNNQKKKKKKERKKKENKRKSLRHKVRMWKTAANEK